MRSLTDGRRSVAGRASVQPSSEGMNASSREGLEAHPFLAVRKERPATADYLKSVVLLAITQFFAISL